MIQSDTMTTGWRSAAVGILFMSLMVSGLPLYAGTDSMTWQERFVLDGEPVLLTGVQRGSLADANGVNLKYFRPDGSPMPESFNRANRNRWRNQVRQAGAEYHVFENWKDRANPSPAAKRRQAWLPGRSALPSVDIRKLLHEDLAREGEAKGVRWGVIRSLARPVGMDEASPDWMPLEEGGWIWSHLVEAEGAFGIRIGLTGLSLPEGAYVVVYDPETPDHFQGPIDTSRPADSRGVVWAETVFSDLVRVDVVIPAGHEPSHVAGRIASLVHIYKSGLPDFRAKVGFCHNDVSCYADWNQLAPAVAALGSVNYDDGFLFCSGCLLADGNPVSRVPYFITANHCIANQGQADTMELYWLYKTPACGGSPPSILSVPMTGGGAEYLAGATRSSGSDFAFLKLRQDPPGETVFAGWSTAAPAFGESVASIHYPDQSFERVSFGSVIGLLDRFVQVRWNSGTTEPGSSGGPLFNAARQFVGQLYGGSASCTVTYGFDEFGRFDRSYPAIARFLQSVPVGLHHIDDARDFDGDGKSDLAVYHAPAARWFIATQSGTKIFQYGYAGTIQVSGDFDGDGFSDPAVYDPNLGRWYLGRSAGGQTIVQFGFPGTVPAPADYDGDGKTDIAVFHAPSGGWYIFGSRTGFQYTQFGFAGVYAVPADYDGDGKADIAVYDPNGGNWYLFRSRRGFKQLQFGYPGVLPTPADYDGDGQADISVFDQDLARWYVSGSTNGYSETDFGNSGDIAVPADYDGDGIDDFCTYRLADGTWFIRQSTDGVLQKQFGWSEAPPVGFR